MQIFLQKKNKKQLKIRIMSKQKLGQEPAFPQCDEVKKSLINSEINTFGMSKRFYAACAAMQGLLANSHENALTEPEEIANVAYLCADELLKQESE